MAQTDATAGDSRLLPLMREAVLMVRMLLHRQLLQDFAAQRPELAPEDRVRLAGALINDLFGTVPADESVVAFARAQRALVEAAMRGLAAHSGKLRPLITDALRMHCICDGQEGVNTTASLLMARAIGLLEEERPMPMPSTFMLAVRAAAVQKAWCCPWRRRGQRRQAGPSHQVVAMSIIWGFLRAKPPVSQTMPGPSEVATSEPRGWMR